MHHKQNKFSHWAQNTSALSDQNKSTHYKQNKFANYGQMIDQHTTNKQNKFANY